MKFAKLLLVLVTFLLTPLTQHRALAAETSAAEQVITRSASQTPVKGSSRFFTGNVQVTPLFGPKHPVAPFSAGYVTFEPGARSHWHTHPAGQHLVVISGVGRTGTIDGKVQEFRTGDVIWCPEGVKHWHGASPDTAMTHMAITGSAADGMNVKWMEPVTEEQYLGKK